MDKPSEAFDVSVHQPDAGGGENGGWAPVSTIETQASGMPVARRMPGFVGDTLEEHPSPTFLGFPVFIYNMVEKVAA